MVFRYEGLYTALLALYLKSNKAILINDKKIVVEVFGVEVNYESRKQKRWPKPFKGRELTKNRQEDLLIIDK